MIYVVSRGIRRVYLVAYSPLTRVHLIPIYRVFGNENYSASTGVVYTKTPGKGRNSSSTTNLEPHCTNCRHRPPPFPRASSDHDHRTSALVHHQTPACRYPIGRSCFGAFSEPRASILPARGAPRPRRVAARVARRARAGGGACRSTPRGSPTSPRRRACAAHANVYVYTHANLYVCMPQKS